MEHTVSLFVTQGSYEIEMHCTCGEVTPIPEGSQSEVVVLHCPKNTRINDMITQFLIERKEVQ